MIATYKQNDRPASPERAGQNAQQCATSHLLHYTLFPSVMQYPCRWLSRLVMRAALALVNAGDCLAGLAVLLDCYAAARGGL